MRITSGGSGQCTFVIIGNLFQGGQIPCSLGHRPASFRLGDFRSVAALVPFGSLRTVGGRAGYSVVKVQL